MSNKLSKTLGSVNGPYYVDTNCIACGVCIVDAPGFIVMNEGEGFAYFSKQPKSKTELMMCEEAIIACPVESIGNDG
ncbi:MAG: ferredoxin [Bacteriovoracaceae bacterium]|nr:ferredoxin [Bacteriovoracaceae bacterium]